MKKIVLLIALFTISEGIYSQELLLDILPLENGIITYSGVVQIENANPEDLNERARVWFAKTFNSSNSVIQMDTKNQIIGKGLFNIKAPVGGMVPTSMDVHFAISIKFKENRYKFVINDFVGHAPLTNGSLDADLVDWNNHLSSEKKRIKRNKETYATIDYRVNEIIKSLEKAMNIKTDDNW